MKLAFVGGTGPEGLGLAMRFAKAGHEVAIGSRSAERGEEGAARIRESGLAPLRCLHPPPAPEDPGWVSIPGGTFQMGAAPAENRTAPEQANEHPRHQVHIDAAKDDYCHDKLPQLLCWWRKARTPPAAKRSRKAHGVDSDADPMTGQDLLPHNLG